MKKILPLLALASLSANSRADDNEVLRHIADCSDSFSRYMASQPQSAADKHFSVKNGAAALKMKLVTDAAKELEENIPGSSTGVKDISRYADIDKAIPISGQWALSSYFEEHARFAKNSDAGVKETYNWVFHLDGKKDMLLRDFLRLTGNLSYSCDGNNCLAYQRMAKGGWQAVKPEQLKAGEPYLQIMASKEGSKQFSISCNLSSEGKHLPVGLIKTRRPDWQLNF
ncbi:hypothetical protein [Chromobacterium subtsugae]|uniref:hypothetical protein n=1 Tax=Chromobacterium subtsugae TaxID=251747 RepID=UPI0006414B19|nr:hypothetical protein [Chromobacterium subtsugae]